MWFVVFSVSRTQNTCGVARRKSPQNSLRMAVRQARLKKGSWKGLQDIGVDPTFTSAVRALGVPDNKIEECEYVKKEGTNSAMELGCEIPPGPATYELLEHGTPSGIIFQVL
jgi:hypothetical protein